MNRARACVTAPAHAQHSVEGQGWVQEGGGIDQGASGGGIPTLQPSQVHYYPPVETVKQLIDL